jgi:hypothetical protein
LPNCTKCKTQIEYDTPYIEAEFGDCFKEACFNCEKCGSPLTDGYVCLNDKGEPRRFKYETGHYFLPECAAALKGSPPQEVNICCICETPIEGRYLTLLDGYKIKPECLEKIGVKPSEVNTDVLLRSKVEKFRKEGRLPDPISPPTIDHEASEQRVREGFAKQEELRKKNEEAAAAKAARQQRSADEQEQQRENFLAEKEKAVADKAQALADKQSRLDAKGKWTLAELKDPQLRKDYFVAELTDGKPEIVLSDADFQTAFNMDRGAFEQLAGWKQKDARKKQGLF